MTSILGGCHGFSVRFSGQDRSPRSQCGLLRMMAHATQRAATRMQWSWEIVLDPRRSHFLGSRYLLSAIPRAVSLPRHFCLLSSPSLPPAWPSILPGSAWETSRPIPTQLGSSPLVPPLLLTSSHPHATRWSGRHPGHHIPSPALTGAPG